MRPAKKASIYLKLIINIIMKQRLTLIIVCFIAITALAQNKADIEVSYEAHHPNLRNSKDDLTSQYIACQL